MADERNLWFERGREILANPNDDTPRYQFAFALEQGEGDGSPNRFRAEFIRLQLRLSRLSPSHPEYMRLATRAYSLQLRYSERWTPAALRAMTALEVEFHRGFVAWLKVPARTLFEYQNRFFEEAPLQHLDIVELEQPDQLKTLLYSLENNGHLGQLVSLRLDGQNLGDENIAVLQDASFSKLRWLSLAHNRIGEVGVGLLMSGRFRRLRFVDLHGNPFDPTPELVYDQGVVIERRSDPRMAYLPEVPWLEGVVRGGQYIPPDRFALFSS